MIRGVGTDLVQTDRLEKSLQNPSFVRYVYAPAEQKLLESRAGRRRLETAAANFAAKEAFLKAAGVGLGGFALSDLAVLRRESGAPYFAPSGAAARWLAENRLTAALSLSHDGGLALAFVVLSDTSGD